MTPKDTFISLFAIHFYPIVELVHSHVSGKTCLIGVVGLFEVDVVGVSVSSVYPSKLSINLAVSESI